MGEQAIAHPEQTAARATDPKASIFGCAKSANVSMFQFGRCGAIQADKSHAIKAGEALLGSDPEKAVFGLSNGPSGILRQSVINLPSANVVMRETVCGGAGRATGEH